MDDASNITYIRTQIDKSFEAANGIAKSGLSSQHGVCAGAFVYCGGYVQACINFGIISPKVYDELIKYCEDKRGIK
jgi:hypothetical protein